MSVLFIRPGTNHAEPCGPVRTPLRRAVNANRHQQVAREAQRARVDVRAGIRGGTHAVGWRGRVERRDLGILEEVLVTRDIELEPEPAAEIGDRYPGAPFAMFDVA